MRKLILIAAIAGCATPPRQPVANDDAELLAAEYSVYSYLLRDSRDFTVADSTNARRAYPACTAETTRDCWRPRDGVSAEAWNDHSRKNVTAYEVQPLFDPALGLRLQRQAGQVEPSCDQPRIVSFTRPGFNKDRSQAVIWLSHRRGKGPFPGCGFVTSSLLVLNKVPGGWTSRSLIVGIS